MEKRAKFTLLALAMIVIGGFGAAPAHAQYSQSYKLMKAIEDGDYYAAKAAILNGGQVNGRNDHGIPYICLAAAKGDRDMVYILLDQGANPDLARRDGDTALMIAAEHGYVDMATTILAHMPDVDAVDRNGETALIKAARLGNREIVTKLIAAKADLDHQDYTGKSALGYALDNRRTRVAKDLTKAGATD